MEDDGRKNVNLAIQFLCFDVSLDINGLSWALPELPRISGALGDKLP